MNPKKAATAAAKAAKTGGIVGQVLTAVNPLDVIRDITAAVTDYKTVKLQEETKRKQISAWESATLENIRAKRDILIIFLERSFDERRDNFGRLFDALDVAMASSDPASVNSVLQGIVLLAQESPFKQLASLDGVRAFLDDPDASVEL